MTQDEIIRMAREAGFDVREGYVAYCYIDALKTFAERVAAAAKAEEREACAKAVEAEAYMFETLRGAKSLAAEIRARGEGK